MMPIAAKPDSPLPLAIIVHTRPIKKPGKLPRETPRRMGFDCFTFIYVKCSPQFFCKLTSD
jgi:hypothetical protein